MLAAHSRDSFIQLGNLIASVNATLQASIAAHYGNDYGIALAAVAGTVAIVIAILTALGTEAKGIAFGRGADPARSALPRLPGRSRRVGCADSLASGLQY